MENLTVRIMVSDAGLHYKDIAHHIGITPEYLSRLMKKELSPGNRLRIIQAIQTMKETEGRRENDGE